MEEKITYTLNMQIADLLVGKSSEEKKILRILRNGTVNKQRVINEIMALEPGIERELVAAVIEYEQRGIERLLLTGHGVNMGLYYARPCVKGLYCDNAWDEKRNQVYVSLIQGKRLREAIARTQPNILGEKGKSAYISYIGRPGRYKGNENELSSVQAGRPLEVRGRGIKLMGSGACIDFIDSNGEKTTVGPDMLALNGATRLVFVAPMTLTKGKYTLRITTWGNGSRLLKHSKTIEKKEITVDALPSTSGEAVT